MKDNRFHIPVARFMQQSKQSLTTYVKESLMSQNVPPKRAAASQGASPLAYPHIRSRSLEMTTLVFQPVPNYSYCW